MSVHEKIKTLRQLKGWSQEEMAIQLGMSTNGYGNIERGETDVKQSRLEDIAEAFGITLYELLGLNEKNVFNCTNHHNQKNHWHIGGPYPSECVQLQAELEKQQLIISHKDQEIAHLKEMVELLKKLGG